ncbi:hypothetical protein DFH07DRAFT_133497 [Mycena maculata]|uniref:Uncharacterized protein n=1 Tax=Mycena maculata TaxID=230809 RepID=A0AAD7MWJ2_9AGAR|nr:hypothetical protein DFH07DRAFT_133497 [Mycena maculata]
MALYRSFGHPSMGDPPPEPSGSICGFYSNFFPILPCCFQLRNDLPASFRLCPVAPAPPPIFFGTFRDLTTSRHLMFRSASGPSGPKNLRYQFCQHFLACGSVRSLSLPFRFRPTGSSFSIPYILATMAPALAPMHPWFRTLHSGTFRFSVFFGVLTKLFLRVFFHVVLPSSDFPLCSGLSGTSGPVPAP